MQTAGVQPHDTKLHVSPFSECQITHLATLGTPVVMLQAFTQAAAAEVVTCRCSRQGTSPAMSMTAATKQRRIPTEVRCCAAAFSHHKALCKALRTVPGRLSTTALLAPGSSCDMLRWPARRFSKRLGCDECSMRTLMQSGCDKELSAV